MRNETINPEYHSYLTKWPSVFHVLLLPKQFRFSEYSKQNIHDQTFH